MDQVYIYERLNEIKEIRNKIKNNSLLSYENNEKEYIDGISVIVPTYKGERYILKCIESLKNQFMDRLLIDIIVIINGERDKTQDILEKYIRKKEINNLHIIYEPIASAGNARNIGISMSKRKYITFIDDDDYVSPNYLQDLYDNASEDRIVISQIADVHSNGNIDYDNVINKKIISYVDSMNPIKELSTVLTMNACKLIPTKKIGNTRYDIELKSGEDIVFYCDLIVKNTFKYYVIPERKKAVYYRNIRENSVSRQEISFDFNVVQRMEVIKRLNSLLNNSNNKIEKNFIQQKINAQSLFINRFLNENYDKRNFVLNKIKEYNCNYIPFEYVKK